jgi:hypothetical protein
MTNPNHEPLHEDLTQSQAYLICSAAEDYLHLVAHPASTKSIIDQLRKIRTEIKRQEKEA